MLGFVPHRQPTIASFDYSGIHLEPHRAIDGAFLLCISAINILAHWVDQEIAWSVLFTPQNLFTSDFS